MTHCIHVYEYVGAEVCPHCGKDTHEADFKTSAEIIRNHYKNGDNLAYVCKECNGTIRIWWSI